MDGGSICWLPPRHWDRCRLYTILERLAGATMHLRQYLREPIPEIEIAAQHLSDAVSAHLQGKHERAEELLRLADNKLVRDWLESLWGRKTVYNQPRRISDTVPVLSEDQRAKPRDATAETKRFVHERDGLYCRFCKIPVIRGAVRSAVHREYPTAVPWEGLNSTQHAAFQCMWAQYDHILPHARGGRSDLENVYLTCAACNYGRGSYSLEEFDLAHPSLHPRREGNWNGLENFR